MLWFCFALLPKPNARAQLWQVNFVDNVVPSVTVCFLVLTHTRSEHENLCWRLQRGQHSGRLCAAKNVCTHYTSCYLHKHTNSSHIYKIDVSSVLCINLSITNILTGLTKQLTRAFCTHNTGMIRITCRSSTNRRLRADKTKRFDASRVFLTFGSADVQMVCSRVHYSNVNSDPK